MFIFYQPVLFTPPNINRLKKHTQLKQDPHSRHHYQLTYNLLRHDSCILTPTTGKQYTHLERKGTSGAWREPATLPVPQERLSAGAPHAVLPQPPGISSHTFCLQKGSASSESSSSLTCEGSRPQQCSPFPRVSPRRPCNTVHH